MVNSAPKVLLAAGGTAGHVNPALVTASELVARGFEVVFLGSYGIEAELINSAGYRLLQIEKLPLYRAPNEILKNFVLPVKYAKLVKQVRKIMQTEKIDAVVGFGGYVSAPAYTAAKRLKIPYLIHEQNVRVGLANKLGAKHANVFTYSFPMTIPPKTAKNSKLIGLPMREITAENATMTENIVNIANTENTKHILITGGSLGAKSINEAITPIISGILALNGGNIRVTHLTGKGKSTDALAVKNELSENLQAKYQVLEYYDELLNLIESADLVIGRAGAGTVHELAMLAKPAILVPLPIGNGEQALNAKLLGKGAKVIADRDFTVANALKTITELLSDNQNLAQMAEFSANSAIFGAGNKLANLVDNVLAMQTLESINNAHFMAISGAGIAPIAKCFEKFANVTGCDSLVQGHTPQHLVGNDTLIYSSAIKRGNPELDEAFALQEKGEMRVLHRSDALNLLLRAHKHSVAIAGSHGKTTITAMIASIFEACNSANSSFVIGAEAKINGSPTNGGKIAPQNLDYIVAEADESDGSFTKYHPEIAVISNTEPDHLDYYGDYNGVLAAFDKFASQSSIVIDGRDPAAYELGVNTLLNLKVPGEHNLIDAKLALKVAFELGIPTDIAIKALNEFEGASRRFEIMRFGDFEVVDDYAHHPTELEKFIDAAIEKYNTDNLVLLFQPHLYSRTSNFAKEFATQLSRVKHPIVTKIYGAREFQKDFPSVSPSTIAGYSDSISTTDDLNDGVKMAVELARQSNKVILSVGAGPTLMQNFRDYIG